MRAELTTQRGLARWARERPAGSLRDSVVNLTAPELAADQMVAAAELAETGGIAASTLRAYIARGEADVPAPQASPNGRSLWARPVAGLLGQVPQVGGPGVRAALGSQPREDERSLRVFLIGEGELGGQAVEATP